MFTEQNSIAFKIISWKFFIRIWKKSSVLKIEVFQDTYSKYNRDSFSIFLCVCVKVYVCVCIHIHTGPKQAIAS